MSRTRHTILALLVAIVTLFALPGIARINAGHGWNAYNHDRPQAGALVHTNPSTVPEFD